MIAIITVILCCAMRNEKEQKKAPSAQPHQSRWGQEKREGTLCERYAHFHVYANTVPMYRNLLRPAPNQGFKTMPKVQRIVELVVGFSCSQVLYRESKTSLWSISELHYVWNESKDVA
jgi:hypothetical protein